MKIRTDRYGITRIHERTTQEPSTPEQKIAKALAHRGIANAEFVKRTRALLVEHSALTIDEAVRVVLHRAGA